MARLISPRETDQYREIHVSDEKPATEWFNHFARETNPAHGVPDRDTENLLSPLELPEWVHPDDAGALAESIAESTYTRRETLRFDTVFTDAQADVVALAEQEMTLAGIALLFTVSDEFHSDATSPSAVSTQLGSAHWQFADADETLGVVDYVPHAGSDK